MTRYNHTKIHKKDIAKAAILAVGVIVVLAVTFVILSKWEDKEYATNIEEYDDNILEPKEISYNGQTYIQKRKVYSYLFIGVDESGTATGTESYIGGGQGDVEILLVVDDLNRTWQLLQLNRDSMVEVPILGINGDVVTTQVQQLCLAHSYGNGLEESCVNTVNTVSNLLDDQPISGYMSLNMDAIGLLNNLVDGVTVTVTSDFSKIDENLVIGETITLTDEEAIEYVRSRRNIDDETNIARMARQRVFMDSLFEDLNSQDADFASVAYDTLKDYMVTDIEVSTASSLFQKLKDYKHKETLTIDGNNVVEDENWAYYLDDNSLQEVILELFYTLN